MNKNYKNADIAHKIKSPEMRKFIIALDDLQEHLNKKEAARLAEIAIQERAFGKVVRELFGDGTSFPYTVKSKKNNQFQ